MNKRHDSQFYENNLFYLTSQNRSLYREALGRREEIMAQIEAIENLLQDLPQDDFTCRRNGTGYKWFRGTASSDSEKKTGYPAVPGPEKKTGYSTSPGPKKKTGHSTSPDSGKLTGKSAAHEAISPEMAGLPARRDRFRYLPKSEMKLAEQLAMHKYLINVRQDLINEKNAIDQFVTRIDRGCCNAQKCHAATGMAELVDPEIQKDRAELEAWQNDDYERSSRYAEDRNISTIAGFCVRSKSEALIANILLERGIPFRYEWVQVIGGVTYAPDFTILHPVSRQIIIWEHFGLMNSSDYQSECRTKLCRYIMAGYAPYRTLISTYENNEHPFSADIANRIVRMMFDC